MQLFWILLKAHNSHSDSFECVPCRSTAFFRYGIRAEQGPTPVLLLLFFCLLRPLVENGVHVDLKQGRGAPWGRGEEGGDDSFVGRAYFTNLLSGKQRSQECWHGDIRGRGHLHCQGVWGWADSSLLPYTSIKRPSAPPTHLPGGADGQEGVGPAGEHSLPVDQQHADVVLALRLQGAVSTGITGLGLAASRRPGIGC